MANDWNVSVKSFLKFSKFHVLFAKATNHPKVQVYNWKKCAGYNADNDDNNNNDAHHDEHFRCL